MLVGSSCSLISIAAEGTAFHDTSVTLVVLDELLKRECLACILFDSSHDALSTDGAIVRDVVVHARVRFRTEYTTVVHESSFVDVNEVAVSVVIDEVAPIHFVHLSRQR